MNKLLACAVTAIGLQFSQPLHAEESFILSHALPEAHIFHPTAKTFMKSLAKTCSGEFNVEYHLGGDLGDWTVQFEQAMVGVIPATFVFANSEVDPRLDVSFLGYVADDWETARKVYGPGGDVESLYKEILSDLGIRMMGTIPVDFGGIAMRKGDTRIPVNLPSDASGVKLRVPPMPIGRIRFEKLGFSVVPLPFSEVYTALQLGTVDGRTFAPPAEIWQMRDVIESYILTNDYFEHAFFAVNNAWFDKLSKAQQACFTTAADTAIAFSWSDAQRQSKDWMEKIKDAGIKIVKPTETQLKAIRASAMENEWKYLQDQLGNDVMARLKKASGPKN